MNKYLLMLTLSLVSMLGIGQVKLDTAKFKIEDISLNLLETKLILTNSQELRLEKTNSKSNFIIETYSKIEKFTVNKNGELVDTLIKIQKFELPDSTFILLTDQKIKLLKRFGKKELGLVIYFSDKDRKYVFYKNSKPTLSGIARLVNGELKTIETNYFPNGKLYSVTDNILNRDTIYYDNGNLRMIKDNLRNSEKNYNEKDGTLERHTYRKEVTNNFPDYEIVIDYYVKNKISERKILNAENLTTILRFKNSILFEKEIITVANNGDRFVEIFDKREKKIKEYTEKNNAVAPVPDNN